MAKKSLNLKGTTGVNYDLDQIESEKRSNPNKALVVQVHRYNPSHPVLNKPNPTNPVVGQIWLSKEDPELNPNG
jgi:hypothetical protein